MLTKMVLILTTNLMLCGNAVQLWNRLLTMDDNRLTKRVLLLDFNQPGLCRLTLRIKSLFESTNLLHIYVIIQSVMLMHLKTNCFLLMKMNRWER